MVWIPGGGFMVSGPASPLYDGTRFAQAGVVLVSIAYRLGPFGFLADPELSHESDAGSGNYGLEDQIAALKWVRRNIRQFGGDPNRVTVFGESSGAQSVSLLVVSPAAKGLFQRAIAQSGAAFQPPRATAASLWPLHVAEANGRAFLRSLGARDLAQARALSAETLIKASQDSFGAFWPVIDGNVITTDPYSAYETRHFNDVPILIGSNSNDGSTSTQPGVTATSWSSGIGRWGPEAQAVLAAYPHSTDADARRASRDLSRDAAFGWAEWTWARLQYFNSKHHAYLYFFDARPSARSASEGAPHGAELAYLFGTFGRTGDDSGVGARPRPQDLELSRLMRDYWLNFATRGDPNGPGLPPWPAFDGNARALVIDSSPRLRPLPNLDKLQIFDRYFLWRRRLAGRPRLRPRSP